MADATRRNAPAILLSLLVAAALPAGCDGRNPVLQERSRNAGRDLAAFHGRRAPAPDGPLTLEQAVGLALDHNLDAALAVRRREIQASNASGKRAALLGRLRATAKHSRLDDPPATSSEGLESGRRSLEPSTSTEEEVTTTDITYVWGAIDFGLSWLEAQQADARTDALGRQVDRIRQELALDTARVYWRAAVLQKAVDEGAAMMEEAEARIARRGERAGETVTDVDALRFQKEMAEMQLRLNAFRRQLVEAKSTLARQVAFAPDAEFRLEAPLAETPPALDLPDAETLENEALLNRPELYEDDRNREIAAAEVRKALLRFFPNVEFVASRGSSTNDFLHHEHWYTLAVDAAMQVLRLPARWHEHKAAKERLALAGERRLLTAMGVLTQVRLALLAHEEATERLRQETRYAAMQAKLVEAVRRRVEEGQATDDALFRAEAEQLFSEIRRLTACGDVYTARERIRNSVGRKPGATLGPAETADATDAATATPGPDAATAAASAEL